MKTFFGLTTEQAATNLQTFGPNVLEEKKESIFLKTLFSELESPIVILLLVSVAISFFLNEQAEAFAILFVVVVNFLFTLFQSNCF